MNDYIQALALALLPAAGNVTGGLLAEAVHVSTRVLSLVLHAASGIVLAVVGIELLPEALEVGPAWLMLLAFVAGGGFAVLLDRAVDLVTVRTASESGLTGAWAIYAGVGVDLFSDGLMIGTSSAIEFGLALLLALGQVPADVPEGFATIATFKRRGVAARTRMLLTAALTVPILLGTTIGFWAVRGQPEELKFGVLAFTAGILLTVAVEELLAEAHEGEEPRTASLFLVGGFALFALLSAYLGS